MKVLLLGEYSGLHNTLKEGLVLLGHEVTLVGDGDGFKNFPVDISIRPTFFNRPLIKYIKLGVYKLFGFDLLILERGLRYAAHQKRLKGYDIVQLINEKPIKTIPSLERSFLKNIFKNNKKTFLLSCGIDSFNLGFLLEKKFKYSLMDPYFENQDLKEIYKYILNYNSESHKKTHQLILENVSGIIASDMDYAIPLDDQPLFKGLIPNPINLDKLNYCPLSISSEIVIFLGINRRNYNQKGIVYFENALEIIQKKYNTKIKVIVAENIPYVEYMQLYKSAHILLDQVYSYDQGYNALEAMANGKVVFTGAETEFLRHFNLQENEVCLNGLADTDYLVEKLSWLIDSPDEILKIGENAKRFVETEHHYLKIAQKYIDVYKTN
jgi:glycosyltransferase involved in cell wall biosynthesis